MTRSSSHSPRSHCCYAFAILSKSCVRSNRKAREHRQFAAHKFAAFSVLCKEMGSEHLYFSYVRWLSQGKVLIPIFELKTSCTFLMAGDMSTWIHLQIMNGNEVLSVFSNTWMRWRNITFRSSVAEVQEVYWKKMFKILIGFVPIRFVFKTSSD